MAVKVLVVEDESDIRDLITLHLQREGYDVEESTDGEGALSKVLTGGFGLLILDWMLPGRSGLEIAREARRKGIHTPILMVTAKAESMDIVMGLEAGADDYVTKPFEPSVLMARVRSLLRRQQAGVSPASAPSHGRIRIEGLEIDAEAFEVRCNGQPIQLTRSEFKLLHALAQNNGKVLTRDQLIQLVQGTDVVVVDRAIDTHVFGLRKKLGACADTVETVRGVGYRVKVAQK